MLETIHEYAHERLTERGEAPATQQAHTIYFLELAERAEPQLRGPDQVAWLDRLDEEQANLRAALAWCLEDQETGDRETRRQGDYGGRAKDSHRVSLQSTIHNLESRIESPAHPLTRSHLGLRLAGALAVFWKGRSHLSEGRGLLVRALEAAAKNVANGAAPDSAAMLAARAKALAGAGVLAVFQGDREAAKDQLTESIAIWRALADRRGLANTLGFLSMALGFRGEWALAEATQEESEQLARAIEDAPALAMALYGQGRALIERGDDRQARARMEESLSAARAAGDIGNIALILTDLGQVVLRQGDYTTARIYSEQALAAARAVRDRGYMAQALNNLGELARCHGDHTQAEACYTESLALFRSQGSSVDIPRLHHNLGYVALHQGDLARARALMIESLAGFRDSHSRRGIAECLAGLAAIALACEDETRAARLWGAAEALRDAAGVAMWAADRIEYERQVAALRAGMDERALAAAWATGRALTLEQAIAEALEQNQEPRTENQ
jgi:tetratricopeptide (TPR) repeat protein